jgi:hypothetical protein
MRWGDGTEGQILADVANTSTDAIISPPIQLYDTNGVALCLFSDINAGVVDPDDFTPVALDGDLDGTWQVFASNDFVPASNSTTYGAVPAAGRWVDITSQFSPAIQTVDHTSLPTTAQYVQADPFTGRAICVVFTPTAGDGKVSAFGYAKSQG